MDNAVIGIDLGGTKISSALFSFDGTMMNRSERPLEGKGAGEVGSLIVQQVTEQLEYAGRELIQVHSTGICVPGISNRNNNTVWAPNIPGWVDYPLYSEVCQCIDDPDIPVTIESDRACYILGEMWQGCAKGCSDAVFLAVGTGIGVGIVANGTLISGHAGVAGAVGWLALKRPYRKEYDQCGNFEYYASGTGIANTARKLISEGGNSELLNTDQLTTREVFIAYDKNDPVAVSVIELAIEYWGMAVANLVSIFNPEKIIFGGGVFGPAIKLIDNIYSEAKKWAQPISIQHVGLEPTMLSGDAGLIGAGYLAMQNRS